MASSDILSQTLHTITSVKLSQLDKQKASYESGKRALLDDAAYETDSRKRAKLLVDRVEKLPAMAPVDDGSLVSIDNLKRFVQQAEYDPCVSDSFLNNYENTIRNELDVQSAKYRYAELYGKLVNEWISAGKVAGQGAESGFVPVGREEMHHQRATWESYVFHAKETDSQAIKSYLESLFISPSKDIHRAFEELRESVKKFQETWDAATHFDEDSLMNTIRGLLRTDTLTDQKRTTLNDFLNNKVVLREIADVLNMRMQTRQNWAWDGATEVDVRRQLNGRYRFYPDDDLLQAIFIHHIGKRWAVRMRAILITFLESPGVEKDATKPMSKEDVRRQRFFLKKGAQIESPVSVEKKLRAHFKSEILLDQLPQSVAEERGGYGSDGKEKKGDSRKSHVAVVQNLLHLVQSEIIMQTRLGSDVTVIRSDLKWFGPSVPHSSIFAVLDFFGVDGEWISFFRRVLECPLRFSGDPSDAPAQIRRRGTPLSTPLADFVAETMLFCMDFAVNQQADGCRLYRLHDDMWLWGGLETCTRAWETMTEFVNLTGLEFNWDKTGSVRIAAAAAAPPVAGSNQQQSTMGTMTTAQGRLPSGHVVWGFLKLDPVSGRFLLDQDKIDVHIDELRLQLEACSSVFDWIQAWNIYGARFFKTNCAQLANCYSRQHVDSMLATFHRIQERLFGAGGAGAHLKRLIGDRFGVEDIPDGYLYFPVSLGGLGLQNPFIHLYLIRDDVIEDPDVIMDDFLAEEEAEYRFKKAAYEEDTGDNVDVAGARHHPPWLLADDYRDLREQPFMSYEEFARHRRRTSPALSRALDRLRHTPAAKAIELRGEVEAALKTTPAGWYGLSGYEQWVCGLYGKDMVAWFGSLVVVDKGVLPTGLLDMLRQSRFKWRG
ncbi:hypothetical protein CORC01_08298 [Colletotrichum orchidophilum]|uniref:Reverse transcriptase domain-containing protein n=1 Tax=Colletotrichum orchidophilum TaxID=1209926 RepID=A0A1G4B4Z8_9PEZI|nr:uncharacterized protein CORC01_08298 [Colletotrichum orchidophilum]OHE96375.1 hypothetical protein CORC01_08298 [Colletotrichum orchidophilum]